MSKNISVPPRPQSANPMPDPTDWINRAEAPVSMNSASAAETEAQVRLTFDIPESLHRRIKIACAERGIKRMAVELRRILEDQFPAKP